MQLNIECESWTLNNISHEKQGSSAWKFKDLLTQFKEPIHVYAGNKALWKKAVMILHIKRMNQILGKNDDLTHESW